MSGHRVPGLRFVARLLGNHRARLLIVVTTVLLAATYGFGLYMLARPAGASTAVTLGQACDSSHHGDDGHARVLQDHHRGRDDEHHPKHSKHSESHHSTHSEHSKSCEASSSSSTVVYSSSAPPVSSSSSSQAKSNAQLDCQSFGGTYSTDPSTDQNVSPGGGTFLWSCNGFSDTGTNASTLVTDCLLGDKGSSAQGSNTEGSWVSCYQPV